MSLSPSQSARVAQETAFQCREPVPPARCRAGPQAPTGQEETQPHEDALRPPPVGRRCWELSTGSRTLNPHSAQAVTKRGQALAEGISQEGLGKPKSMGYRTDPTANSSPTALAPWDDL